MAVAPVPGAVGEIAAQGVDGAGGGLVVDP